MDTGLGQPANGPFGKPFLDMVENEIEQLHPEPLGMTLEGVEASIEQSMPLTGMPDASPDTMLDLVEHSTESQLIPSTLPEHMQDHRLWNMMSNIETATENQVIKPEEQAEVPAPEPDQVYGSFPRRFVPHLGNARIIRERLYPERRMTGRGTGIRFGGGSMTYCQLRDNWITPEECDSCDSFEPASDTDDDNEHCRYAF